MDTETLLEIIKKHRKELRITTTDMSHHLGYKYPSGYANLEYGKRKLSFEKAVEISKILNVSLEELFFDS